MQVGYSRLVTIWTDDLVETNEFRSGVTRTGHFSRSPRVNCRRRCRPDWDIDNAQQRAAWAKGEKTRFLSVWNDADAGVERTRIDC